MGGYLSWLSALCPMSFIETQLLPSQPLLRSLVPPPQAAGFPAVYLFSGSIISAMGCELGLLPLPCSEPDSLFFTSWQSPPPSLLQLLSLSPCKMLPEKIPEVAIIFDCKLSSTGLLPGNLSESAPLHSQGQLTAPDGSCLSPLSPLLSLLLSSLSPRSRSASPPYPLPQTLLLA